MTGTSLRTIILVEDDDLVRLSFDRLLSMNDFRVIKFASAEEALTSILNGEGEVIITDFNLPGMNGIELVRIMRNRNVQTPVIVISAIHGTNFESVARSVGAQAVLEKPINLDELGSIIEQLLSES